jgi:hypothetical protein
MLKVQEYLATHGLARLKTQLAIGVVEHPEDPLVILNYDQLDSPKADPVVRQCRGLTLERDTWKVVAKSFDRFFNWGEMAHEQVLFDWSDFLCQTKEDGSLILVYHYRGHWRINTRGSFGNDPIHRTPHTWREVVSARLGDTARLDPALTYVCELVSPHNPVVRKYAAAELYLLTTFATATSSGDPQELPDEETDARAREAGLPQPQQHHFCSITEIKDWLRKQEIADPTFEGVVVRDRHNHRWKIKSRSYLSFKGVVDERGNTNNPKFFVPFILGGEDAEFLAYFPQVADAYAACKARVDAEYHKLRELWLKTRDIAEQKAFAQAVQKQSPFSSVLFLLRKQVPPSEQTEQDLRRLWRQAEGQVLDWLKSS